MVTHPGLGPGRYRCPPWGSSILAAACLKWDPSVVEESEFRIHQKPMKKIISNPELNQINWVRGFKLLPWDVQSAGRSWRSWRSQPCWAWQSCCSSQAIPMMGWIWWMTLSPYLPWLRITAHMLFAFPDLWSCEAWNKLNAFFADKKPFWKWPTCLATDDSLQICWSLGGLNQ